MDPRPILLWTWNVLDSVYINISSDVLVLDYWKRDTIMPGLGLSLRKRIIQDPERLEPSEYNWFDLGRVGYGLRNDEGSVHVHMQLGVSKGNRPDYPPQLIKVIEKYYGYTNIGTMPHSSPHKTESVLFHKPNNLIELIKRFTGKDTRTITRKDTP